LAAQPAVVPPSVRVQKSAPQANPIDAQIAMLKSLRDSAANNQLAEQYATQIATLEVRKVYGQPS
jgi:hypothetical protein